MVAILFLFFALGISFAICAGLTLLVQYAVEGIWHTEVPFWPTFALVFVLTWVFCRVVRS